MKMHKRYVICGNRVLRCSVPESRLKEKPLSIFSRHFKKANMAARALIAHRQRIVKEAERELEDAKIEVAKCLRVLASFRTPLN